MCCKKQDSFYLKQTICCRNLRTCEKMVNNVFPFSFLHKQITLQLFILFSHLRFFWSFCAIFQLFWWLVQEQESPYHAFLDIWSHLHLWCRNWSQGPTDTQGEDKGFIFFRLALKQIGNTVEHSVSDQPKCEDLFFTYENGTTGGQMYELSERKFTAYNFRVTIYVVLADLCHSHYVPRCFAYHRIWVSEYMQRISTTRQMDAYKD